MGRGAERGTQRKPIGLGDRLDVGEAGTKKAEGPPRFCLGRSPLEVL